MILLITIVSIILTIWNNSRYKNTLQKKKIVQDDYVERNIIVLEKFYFERFGEKNFRETVFFHSISSEKNIEIKDINNLYAKGEK